MMDYHVNWIAVLVATIAGYALGAAWYSPPLFATQWMADLGKQREEMGKMGQAMTVGFIATLVTALSIELVLAKFYEGTVTVVTGVKVGLLLGVGVYAVTLLSDYMYANYPRRLFMINAGYRVLMMVIMGAILGAWR
ncbi:MAG: hypothetical protein JWO05_90 [Gemmatimonadetes bacterium]|nr:hypothetical protein [Gemmatimonadota bacterium]